jgi:hypothetical protein
LFVNSVDNQDVPIFTWKAFLVKRKGGSMDQNDKTGEVTASIEELAIYNMLLTEAIYELLADKGILTRAEVTERIKKLKSETKVNLRPPN